MSTLKSFGLGAALLLMLSACAGSDATGIEASQPAQEEASASNELLRKPCASSNECRPGSHCTTEDGVCNRPPGCGPGDICPAVCYGTCTGKLIPLPPTQCGPNVCSGDTFCCNASCGTCAPRGGACTQQVCESPI